MPNLDPTNLQQTKELLSSVLSNVGAHQHLSDAQLKLFSLHKEDSQSGDTSQKQTTIDEKKIPLLLVLESLREARATDCSQLKAEHSFVKTIFGIKVFDDTIGAALTNGVLAAFPTSYIFAGLGFVATDDLGYRAGGRNYQPLVPGQRSGDINDATLYVQHADHNRCCDIRIGRNRFFDVGIERIPVTLGNYDQLKTEYYAQFLNQKHQEEITKYIAELTKKEQHTTQELEDLTNLQKLLKLPSQPNNASAIKKITDFLKTKQDQFEDGAKIKEESDIFFIEKFLSGELELRDYSSTIEIVTLFGKSIAPNDKEEVTLDSILTRVKEHKTSDALTFEDQQIARIKYELLDKKYNQGEKTEELKNQTLQALNNARSIAKKRQEYFLNKLNSLFASNDFKDCKDSTAFYNKLDSEDSLKIYKDLFNECEHWASHHPQCSDGLKEFLEAVVENKKQTTNYLLTKDRTSTEKAQDVVNFYATVAALCVIFVELKKLGLEHHFAEWGREAGIAISNSSVGHFIANSQFAHNATAFASAVANSPQVHTISVAINTLVNSTPVMTITKGFACLAGIIKSIPVFPVVVAGGAGVLATGYYLRVMDYPEPENIQDIIKQGPSASVWDACLGNKKIRTEELLSI